MQSQNLKYTAEIDIRLGKRGAHDTHVHLVIFFSAPTNVHLFRRENSYKFYECLTVTSL